jgi:hypothetical protein
MWNHEQKIKLKNKIKTQDSIGKSNFLLSTLPFSTWTVLATWLHIRAPHKI